MATKLLNLRLPSLVVFVKRSVIHHSKFNLGNEMKWLNDNKQFKNALELFEKYQTNNLETFSSLTITQALKACAHLKDLQRGNTIHHLVSSRVKHDCYILASLIHLYMQCGDRERAQSLFNTTTNKTSSMYGAMMKGYVTDNLPDKAIDLFKEINKPDEVNVIVFFNACAQLGTTEALNLAKKVSKEIPKSFYSNSRLLTSLLDALMKCGDVVYAQSLFDTIKRKEMAMYGAMMKGYITNNLPDKAIGLFKEINKPDEVNVIVYFNACAQLGTTEALNLAKNVSKEIPKSFYSNSRLLTSLLDALMKCGDVAYAQSLFDTIKRKEMAMYGAMMNGYAKNNLPDKAIDLFNKINHPDEVVITLLFNACARLATTEGLNLTKKVWKDVPKRFHSDAQLLTSLLDALIKCGDSSSADILFSKMKKSVETYGNLMNGFIKENNPEKTLNLFHRMKIDGITANSIIYLSITKALSEIGDYLLSQSIIKQIPEVFLVDNRMQNALIDMWSKTGSVDQAKQIFENILQPDQIGYTAMINCYGLNGMGIQAIELYRQMPQEFIDEVTYICVLNACSHSGLVDEGRSIFRNILNKTERIYATMIDCLSRASMFEEAQSLIDEYERSHSPGISMYMALLSGARNEKNTYLSQIVYDRMTKLFPKMINPLTSAAVLLANVYASSGEIGKATDIRIQLHKSGVKKLIGLTWTSTNGQLFRFRAHDRSHPRSSEIYTEIEKISKETVEHGHQYDPSWITRPLEQDESVASVLCGHSERLAIAWNFVVNPNTKRIQVTKNLRVCGDCHRAIKLIAAIRQCEIILRDANRIHHFHKNGKCSCNDYF